MIPEERKQKQLNSLKKEIKALQQEIASLKESAVRNKALFESANDAIFVMEDDRFIDCNQKAAEMFGCQRGDLLGETPYEKFSPPFQPDGLPSSKKALQKIKAAFAGQPQFFPWTHCRRDGSLFEAEVSLSLVEIGSKKNVLAIVRDITARKKAEEMLQKSLKEKEILLQEIHHRVKNNLQIIVSLLRLQISSEEDSRLVNMFRECQNRIMAMAFVHEKLYQSHDLTRVVFTQYIRDFAQELSTAFGIKERGIELKTFLEEIELDINRAIPCGLIFNELLTNAIKYAFPGKKIGEIIIRLQRENQDQISLEVCDSGVGLPSDFDQEAPKSLGLMLVNSLTAQINGKLTIDTSHGTTFKIVFPG